VPHERNAFPDRALFNSLRDYLERRKDLDGAVRIGKTVTTDATFRQTLRNGPRWRDEGIFGVEMELPALLAVARYHAIPAVGLLIVSDQHDLEGQSPWTWGGKGFTSRRLQAIDLLIDFVRSVRPRLHT
jgi:nucleoside phosphorylase